MGDTTKEFKEMVEQALRDTGKDLKVTAEQMAQLMREAQARLQPAAGLPGFQEAISREVKAIAIRAGIAAVDAADKVDARWWGLLTGALTIAAGAIPTSGVR